MRYQKKILIFLLTICFTASSFIVDYNSYLNLDKLVVKADETVGINDDYGNSMETAAQVNLNESISGSIENQGDIDFFKVIVAKHSQLDVSTTGTTDTFGELLNEAGSSLISNDDSGGLKNFSFQFEVFPGTYYITVKDFYPERTGQYTIVTRITDFPEDDYGNDSGAAAEININKTIQGEIQYKKDIDFFKFNIEQKYQLNISSEGATDTFGILYDANGQVLASNDDDGVDKNFQIVSSLEPGTYFIAVKHCYEDRLGQYSLSIKEIVVPKDDYGNSIDEAQLIKSGVEIAGGIQIKGDLDYFKFTVSKLSKLELYTTGSTDTFGSLFDETGSLIAKDDDTGIDKNFQINSDINPGTYYIEVKDFYYDKTGDYSLMLKLTENQNVEDYRIVSLNQGDSNTCAFEYDGSRYAYIGANTTPARIIKFDLKEMKRVSSIDFPSGEKRDETRVAALISASTDTIIHASFTDPCVFTKIDTKTMKITGTLKGEAGNTSDKQIRTMAYDGKYVYAATYSKPSNIIKFDPVTMKKVASYTFDENEASNIFKIQIVGNYIVGVCDEDTDKKSKIFRLNKNNFNLPVSSIYVNGVKGYHSLCTDGRYVYAATDTNPIQVVKVDALSIFMLPMGIYKGVDNIEQGNFSIVHDGKNIIVGTWNFYDKDKLIKINPLTMKKITSIDFLPSYPADLTYIAPYIYTCTDNATGNVVRILLK
jgi:hypothetical protein